MTQRQLFLQHVAPTSEAPLCFEIKSAQGATITDVHNKEYIDAIGGISVANIGHSNPIVIAAATKQMQQYMHTMVYGEMIQAPQVQYATLLASLLPNNLQSIYFTNSGAEATEAAMKLAKRVTSRTQMVAAQNSYHGSTQGALSLIGHEYWRNAYRPLLPNIFHYPYNSQQFIDGITNKTAAVFVETIQAESGVLPADEKWILAVQKKCNQTGALLILDEAQAGFGRTGKLWGFQHYNGLVPDMVLLAKALGGGMPMGALVTSQVLMANFAHSPLLGHISTFAGHPVCCAAGMAACQVLLQEKWIDTVEEKGAYLQKLLEIEGIECVRRKGLWMAIFYKDYETNKKIVDACIENGVFTDWFLFASNALRISPPLNISMQQIETLAKVISKCSKQYC